MTPGEKMTLLVLGATAVTGIAAVVRAVRATRRQHATYADEMQERSWYIPADAPHAFGARPEDIPWRPEDRAALERVLNATSPPVMSNVEWALRCELHDLLDAADERPLNVEQAARLTHLHGLFPEEWDHHHRSGGE